jgi:endonuclease G
MRACTFILFVLLSTTLYSKSDNYLDVISRNKDKGQMLSRIGYVTSYNKKTRNPNWVAWHLAKEHTDGPYPRKGVPYYGDDGSAYGIGVITQETFRNGYFVDLEAEKPRQEHSDWREHPANIDHGHVCPAADCKWSKEVMNQSFLLTNMCPQNHNLNEGDWATLEESCRKWANKYGDIYIVAGPIFYNADGKTFGANRIAIPDAFFKVVLCMQGTPKAIGFIFKNDSSSQPMRDQIKSVDEIEEITGLDFFSALPDSIEDKIEAISEFEKW